MISFAGISLTQATPKLTDWIARNIPTRDVVEFRPAPRLTKLNLPMPYADARDRPIKLGSLYWPVGASRWAQGHFLATESQLADIRTAGGLLAARTLTIDDGTKSISTAMYALPPRPLTQIPPDGDTARLSKWTLPVEFDAGAGEPLYLLTLVDDRYYWWHRVTPGANDLAIVEGLQVVGGSTFGSLWSWQDVFDALAGGLGITIYADTINAAYLYPPAALASFQEFLPLVLDLAAFSVGHRVVRQLDGTVKTQSATTARTAMQAQIDAHKDRRLAGGQMSI